MKFFYKLKKFLRPDFKKIIIATILFIVFLLPAREWTGDCVAASIDVDCRDYWAVNFFAGLKLLNKLTHFIYIGDIFLLLAIIIVSYLISCTIIFIFDKRNRKNNMFLYKKWLLFVPPLIATYYVWEKYSSTKAECKCLWNALSYELTSIVGLFILFIQVLIIYTLIKSKSKKIYIYYFLWLIVSFFAYIFVMGILMNRLSQIQTL